MMTTLFETIIDILNNEIDANPMMDQGTKSVLLDCVYDIHMEKHAFIRRQPDFVLRKLNMEAGHDLVKYANRYFFRLSDNNKERLLMSIVRDDYRLIKTPAFANLLAETYGGRHFKSHEYLCGDDSSISSEIKNRFQLPTKYRAWFHTSSLVENGCIVYNQLGQTYDIFGYTIVGDSADIYFNDEVDRNLAILAMDGIIP